MSGNFFVIDALDGGGGETQSNLIVEYLKSKKVPVEKLTYPDYNSPTGKFIDEYLHSKHDLPLDILFLLHTMDRVKDKEKIKSFLEEGKIIIADRWFTSTLAYQCTQGFELQKAVEIGSLLGIPKPDNVIYLKISAETSMKRKFGEKGSLDRLEKDKKFLENVSKQYEKLATENIFGNWTIIDGEKTKEVVFEKIKSVLQI